MPARLEALTRAEREGRLVEKLRFYSRASLLIIDEIGYLPITNGGANLFFQLVNARYEKGAMILTSNRGFAEWGEVFGDPVVATALLDRLLHHAVVVQIDGANAYVAHVGEQFRQLTGPVGQLLDQLRRDVGKIIDEIQRVLDFVGDAR